MRVHYRRVCVFSYLLVLSDSLLLLLDAPEFQCVGPVSPRDAVALGAVRAADLTPRPRRLVDVRAGRARPTLRHKLARPFVVICIVVAVKIYVLMYNHQLCVHLCQMRPAVCYLGGCCFGAECLTELRHLEVDEVPDVSPL